MARHQLHLQIALFIVFASLALVGFYYVDLALRKDFAVSHLQAAIAPEADDFEVPAYLDQPFVYLGKGTQAFVFESKDHMCVLKILRSDRYDTHKWISSLPLPSSFKKARKEVAAERERKRQSGLESVQLADQELKEESGLLLTHLHPTKTGKKLEVQDCLNAWYTLDLDKYAFVVQKKGETFDEHMEKLIEQNRIQEAKECLTSLIALLKHRFEAAIDDHDPTLHRNAGFLGNSAFFIDIGQFEKLAERKNGADQHEELKRITRKIALLLEKDSPDLANHLSELLN